MPEEPVVLLDTEMPVVAEFVFTVKPVLMGVLDPDGCDDRFVYVEFIVCRCPGSVTVAVWVWLTTIASALPPVSSAVSNSALPASNPTGTRPAPNAAQVPKPSNVPGLVAFVALM